jgi:hypothetical protein
MGKGNEPKLASCAPSDVFKALKKIGGFSFYEGAKHTKVIHMATGKSSTIPRHGIVNRHLLKDFVEDYLVKDIGLTKEEIYKHLWC